jgi:Protein-arginine deiminase (PAD)
MLADDPWQQDGYEAGYAQTPYASLPIVMELPRARAQGPQIRDQLRQIVLAPGVGLSTRISIPAGSTRTTFDSGGNLEGIPQPNGPALIFRGESMSSWQTDFFAAQGVQSTVAVNSNWLVVGHIDEVTSIASSGKLVMADPDAAWALLLWANQVNPNAMLGQNMNGNKSDGVKVSDVVSGAIDTSLRSFNFDTVLAAANLPSVRAAVQQATGATNAITTPVRTAGASNASLLKGGALPGFFTNQNVWDYEVRFVNAADPTEYELWYRTAPDQAFQKAGTGYTTNDEVFPSASAFLLRHYWQGTTAVGDVLRTRPTRTRARSMCRCSLPISATAGPRRTRSTRSTGWWSATQW